MCKGEPRHDGPKPDESQETGDNHQTYLSSVVTHRFPLGIEINTEASYGTFSQVVSGS